MKIPQEKLVRMQRKYERLREKRASSMLSTYSTELQRVMRTLPLHKLSPPFKASGATMISRNQMIKTIKTGGKSVEQ